MSKPGKSASRPLMSIEETIHRRLQVNMEFVYHVPSCHYVERVPNTYPIQLSIAYNIHHTKVMLGGGWGQQYANTHVSEYLERKSIIENVKKYVGEFY